MDLLKDIIDPQENSFEELQTWISGRIEAIRATDFTPDIIKTFEPIELREDFIGSFGPESRSVWRRFFIAALLADWACYDNEVDRADFSRLKYIMTSAYKYFRIWVCRLPDGKITPVGYTAWYPISEFVYKGALNKQIDINDRGMFMPLRFVDFRDIKYAYAFNVSVVKGLRNTVCSRRIIKSYQEDRMRLGKAGVVAITVDEPGKKFSRLDGFSHIIDVVVQGGAESVFIKKPTN